VSEGHKKPKPESRRKKAHWALRLLGWLLALLFLGVIGVAATFFIGYKMTDIPDPNRDFQTNTTLVFYGNMEDRQQLGRFSEQNRMSVELKTVPQYVQNAHIAAEDRTFWTNPGIEPTAMVRAAWNIARGDDLQGGSTITQQYVKLMYLTQERTVSRKFKELFIAIKLSRSDNKSQILEDYLNTIYYGRGAYGIRAAGQAFYGKNQPKDLTIAESAVLATILNNPSTFNPDEPENKKRILERYRYVLDGMRQMGTITAEQEAALAKKYPEPKKEPKSNKYEGPNGFLLAMAKDRLKSEAGFSEEEIAGGGLRVFTTFDADLQKKAVEAVQGEEQPEEEDGKKVPLNIGIASVRPGTGELVAMYGGPDYLKSQLNYANRGAQPGSAFKPLALAAGLKDGVSLKERFEGNGPIDVAGQELDNEFGEDYGPVNMLEATEKSINTAYYDMTLKMDDGPRKIADAAEAAGLPKIPDNQVVPAITLGVTNNTPIQMANAYATFAAEGMHTDLVVIKEVQDANGKVLYKAKPKQDQAFEADVARDTTYAMQQVVDRPGGTGYKNARKIDRPAAGKTGTAAGVASEHLAKFRACVKKHDGDAEPCNSAQDTLTSWWVGYTPQLSTAVVYRAGKDGQGDLDAFTNKKAFFGSDWPALTWMRYMKAAHEGMDVEEFPEPTDENREIRQTPKQDDKPTRTPSSPPTQPSETPSDPPSETPSDRPTETRTPKPPHSPKPTGPTRPTFTFPSPPGGGEGEDPSG
jgi:membrane peptidoglycan carboxypeptidase